MEKRVLFWLIWGGLHLLCAFGAQAQFVQNQKLLSIPQQEQSQFGGSLDVDPTQMVVGAPGENAYSGAVYGFEKANGVWNQIARLQPADPTAQVGDGFGMAVALSGSILVVGAPNQDTDANGVNFKENAGAVYVFQKTRSGWIQSQKLVASDRSSGDGFGYSVAVSNNTIVVGAIYHSTDAGSANFLISSGAVYVFEYGTSGWTQTRKLVASDRSINALFGAPLALSGGLLVVGSISGTDGSGANYKESAGAAYVFERGSSGWAQTQKLVTSDRAEFDRFGNSLALAGATLLVGAMYHSSDAPGGNFKYT
jgi:hypothetical protein